MHTATLSVVSDVADAGELEEVRRFINNSKSLVCVNIATGVEQRPGVYVDTIVAATYPLPMTHETLVTFPAFLKTIIESNVCRILTVVIAMLALILLPCGLLIDRDNRSIAFSSGIVALLFVFGINMCQTQWGVFKMVLRTFEFWFLSANHTIICVCISYLYVLSGVPSELVALGFFFYNVVACVVLFGIDAAPFSRQYRIVAVMIYLIAYAFIALSMRFAENLFDASVYDSFVTTTVYFGPITTTFRVLLITYDANVCLFFAKYALFMSLRRDFVLLTFDAKYSQNEVGTIEGVAGFTKEANRAFVRRKVVDNSNNNKQQAGGGHTPRTTRNRFLSAAGEIIAEQHSDDFRPTPRGSEADRYPLPVHLPPDALLLGSVVANFTTSVSTALTDSQNRSQRRERDAEFGEDDAAEVSVPPPISGKAKTGLPHFEVLHTSNTTAASDPRTPREVSLNVPDTLPVVRKKQFEIVDRQAKLAQVARQHSLVLELSSTDYS